MRKPMVTRTLISTKATVMCVNIATESTETREVSLPRTYKDNSVVLKKVKELLDKDGIVAAHVIKTEVVEQLYGMTEDKFMQYAELLPPRKNADGANEDTDTDTNTSTDTDTNDN